MTEAADRIARWWFVLEEFDYTAERVLTSEIARRQDLATVGTTMNLIASMVDGVPGYRIQRERPRISDIEAAAARVRPLFLESDATYHGNVTAAMSGLAKAASAPAEQMDMIKALKKAWQNHDKGYRWALGANVGSLPTKDQLRTDRQIAHDFVYGNLVHADPEARERLRLIPVDDRLFAAVVWVADATRRTLATKQLIVDPTEAGHLPSRS